MAWTTVAAPIRTSPVPNTPGRSVSKVTGSALSRRFFVAWGPSEPGPIQSSSGPWPMASRTRSQSIVNSVPGDGSGRRRAGRVRLAELVPDELDAADLARLASSTMIRVGAAWKMAWTPSSIASWTSLDGRHVLHVPAVDQGDLGGALADGRPGAVHRGEPAADDHDPLAGVTRDRAARASPSGGTRVRR